MIKDRNIHSDEFYMRTNKRCNNVKHPAQFKNVFSQNTRIRRTYSFLQYAGSHAKKVSKLESSDGREDRISDIAEAIDLLKNIR